MEPEFRASFPVYLPYRHGGKELERRPNQAASPVDSPSGFD
jgi:hypothetical protein